MVPDDCGSADVDCERGICICTDPVSIRPKHCEEAWIDEGQFISVSTELYHASELWELKYHNYVDSSL